MQKQNLISPIFLATQSTYTGVEIALCSKNLLIDIRTISKFDACKLYIPTLHQMMQAQNLSIGQIDFIAVNKGPGPFTSLRTVIASINGLCAALRKPIVEVNGLHVFLDEHICNTHDITIALLNAFGKDVYFGIDMKNGKKEIGCDSITALLDHITRRFSQQSILFIGNGAELYRDLIYDAHGSNISIANPTPQMCSLQAIAQKGEDLWTHGLNRAEFATPLYLKDYMPHMG